VSVSTFGVALGDRFGRRGRLVRTLRPAYSRCLRAAYGRRGLPWSVNGERVRIDPDVRHLMPRENEPDLHRFLRDNIRPGDVVFDIGAFLGLYAITAARRVGAGGCVVALEPSPWTFAVLWRHRRMNGIAEGRLRLVEAAAGAVRGRRPLLAHDDEPYRNMLAPSEDAARRLVDVVTVDDVCEEIGRAPDWIRMDVQGFEFEVLAGARRALRDARAALTIVAEMHPEQWPGYGVQPAEAEERLAALGLRARSLVPGGRPFAQGAHALIEPLG